LVAEIGLIIGCYVMTRMLEVLSMPSDRRTGIVTAAAVVTLGLTALITVSLLSRGLSGIQ
jgi:hypothetical protein